MPETPFEMARKALDHDTNHQLLLFAQRVGRERLNPSDPIWYLLAAIAIVMTNLWRPISSKIDSLIESNNATRVELGQAIDKVDIAANGVASGLSLKKIVETMNVKLDRNAAALNNYQRETLFERVLVGSTVGVVVASLLGLTAYMTYQITNKSDMCAHIQALAHDAKNREPRARAFLIYDANNYGCKS
jgi:hypothetical protein